MRSQPSRDAGSEHVYIALRYTKFPAFLLPRLHSSLLFLLHAEAEAANQVAKGVICAVAEHKQAGIL